MCGIFGWMIDAQKMSHRKLEILAAALSIYNDNRGGDSWGYAFRRGRHTITIRKGTGKIADHVPAGVLANHTLLMAHTRKATTGSITPENAHPFEIGSIVGAHNGIVYNHRDLNSRYNRTYDVDSMQLFGHIDEGLPLAEIKAYGSVEFMSRRKPGVFLAVFDGELAVVRLGSDRKHPLGTVWSSSRHALASACRIAEIPFTAYELKGRTLYEVDDLVLWETKESFPVGKTSFRNPLTTCGDDGSEPRARDLSRPSKQGHLFSRGASRRKSQPSSSSRSGGGSRTLSGSPSPLPSLSQTPEESREFFRNIETGTLYHHDPVTDLWRRVEETPQDAPVAVVDRDSWAATRDIPSSTELASDEDVEDFQKAS